MPRIVAILKGFLFDKPRTAAQVAHKLDMPLNIVHARVTDLRNRGFLRQTNYYGVRAAATYVINDNVIDDLRKVRSALPAVDSIR